MNTTMTTRAACLDHQALFQHPLVEGDIKTAQLSQARPLIAAAKSVCDGCPLVRQCLFDAVVGQDVSGVAGGTTVADRVRVRRTLGIETTEKVGCGAVDGRLPSGAWDPQYVKRLREQNTESLEGLARRLGVSLSTIKRLLRKANSAAATVVRTPPSPEIVWYAAHGGADQRAA